MTKREAAIVSAYTGILLGSLDDLYEYASELLGFNVCTHDLYLHAKEIKEKSKKDFINLKVE